MIGRIPVTELSPVIEGGRWSAKATVGEPFPVRATVFREGHDAYGATAVLFKPDGTEHSRAEMIEVEKGLDRYEGWLMPDAEGDWSFTVEGYSDPYATWVHDATIKIDAGIDVDLMREEGSIVLERAAASTPERTLPAKAAEVLGRAVAALRGPGDAKAALAAATSDEVREVLAAHPLRDFVSPAATFPLVVHRKLAMCGAWYEMFPRSEGSYFDEKLGHWVSGTFVTAAKRLPAVADMGFDVIYLTPIHPIGTTNRKGRNNTLEAKDGDPGSPYGIGAKEGGHDAIHPELGTFDEFDAFVARARDLGLEVALDIALQCSPDHPWVHDHPEWFTKRADGTIAYAENPPKKYQDIYPLNFDNDPDGIYEAIRAMLQTWIDHGVTLFRVDNPHTKPLNFWQKLLAHFHDKHPGVVFLAEAFTRPAMMRTLGAIGFHQSYTYFTWRHTKEELGDYFTEVARETSAMLRPSFWPTTHDILTPYMTHGGASAFAIRAVLAATGSPTWGIYSGYEFIESTPRPGFEEQIDNEKYEFKPRPWGSPEAEGMTTLLTMLNRIRDAHPALQQLHDITIHPTTDEQTLCFSKRMRGKFTADGRDDIVIVVVNLDPHAARDSLIHFDLSALGIDVAAGDSPMLEVHDEMSGQDFVWGPVTFVRLDPRTQCAHIVKVK
ncbi:alpha-1,4-glucan--maltose-1-phosphate maltosyltransferase [Bowdeniella nasicola]|uniref:Alpha-1,4-glucan:maltose-1-phosphate maltosyltransferase n=1 Tax=Bowdeniella nasicola TaxID=208480 RepID=A0A1Q5Q1L2_9ACTO|nr:alpha-1,4-glucan--maltose-1-phosphate maltosyltransferase [Bowdeniella nasicola]OKL53599.1 alpha-1,4-glucan--maltose-1-phosphate maltosyltransferase [Bowdeniella nasicola]